MKIIAINEMGNIVHIDINDKDELMTFYENKGDYEFFCSCNKKTRMTLGKKKNYYVQTIAGEKHTHKNSCIFKGDTFKSLKGYHIDDDGNLCFSVSEKKTETDIDNKDDDLINELLISNEESITRYFQNRNIKKNKLTFNAFVTKILIDSWNNYYKRYYRNLINDNPDTFSRLGFLNFFFGKSNTYKYNNVIVNDALSQKDPNIWFEMGYLMKSPEIYDLNTYIITLKNNRPEAFERKIKKDMLEEAFNSVRANTGKYIVFLRRKNQNKYKKIEEIVVIPVNSYGLPSESSYEANFYDNLINNKILFTKPYEIYNEDIYPYVPDVIIDEKSSILNSNYNNLFKCNKKDIIVELFGVQGNKQYDDLKNKKVNIGNKINNSNTDLKFISLDVNSMNDVDIFFNTNKTFL